MMVALTDSELPRSLEGNTRPLCAITFADNRGLVFAGDEAGSLLVWQLDWDIEDARTSHTRERALDSHLELFAWQRVLPGAPLPQGRSVSDHEINAAVDSDVADLLGDGGTTQPSAAQTATGARFTLAGYELVKVLGTGGMGRVYLGSSHATGQQIAIKTLMPEAAANDYMRNLFMREVQLSQRLAHPNIARCMSSA